MPFWRKIEEDIDWRVSELTTIKTFPLHYGLSEHHEKFFLKYSVPSIYAVWEGFVKNSFRLYIEAINNLRLNHSDLNLNVLSHAVSSQDKLSLENPRMNFNSKLEFVDFFQKYISQPIIINEKIPTASNINYDVIAEILSRFNLAPLSDMYKPKLAKLLRFRNDAAHGESSIPVKKEHIDEFTSSVQDLMNEVFLRISKGYDAKSFLKTM